MDWNPTHAGTGTFCCCFVRNLNRDIYIYSTFHDPPCRLAVNLFNVAVLEKISADVITNLLSTL